MFALFATGELNPKGTLVPHAFAAFLTHGGGGRAMGSLESIAESFKFRKLADSVSINGRPQGQDLGKLKALGAILAGVKK